MRTDNEMQVTSAILNARTFCVWYFIASRGYWPSMNQTGVAKAQIKGHQIGTKHKMCYFASH